MLLFTMPQHPKSSHEHNLIEEMENLEDAVRSSVVPASRQIVRGFFTGMFSALGALVAIAILVPLLIYFLKNIEWIPLIGTFIERISNYTQR